MKKFLLPIYLLAFIILSNSLKAQTGTIEVGVTYDQSFEDLVGASNVNSKIQELLEATSLVAWQYNIGLGFDPHIKKADIPVKGLPQYELLKGVSGLWINSNSCHYPDVLVHLTQKQIQGGGGFSAANSCYDPSYVGQPAGSIVKLPTFESGRLNFVHEMFHSILNIGHTDASLCQQNPNYLMCEGGPVSLDPDDWQLTPGEVTILGQKLEDPYSCYNVQNIPENATCFNCNDIAAMPGGTNFNQDEISNACGEPNEFIVESTIMNDCQVDNRQMIAEFHYNDDEIEILEINSEYGSPVPSNRSSYNKMYTFTKNLLKDESFTTIARYQVIGGSKKSGGPFSAVTELDFDFDPPSSAVFEGLTNIYYPNVLLDLSNYSTLYYGQVRQAYYNTMGEYPICPDVVPTDVVVDGNLRFSGNTICNMNFYMSPTSSVTMLGNSTFNNCNFLTCDGSEWEGIEVINSADVTMNDCSVKDAAKGILVDVYNADLTLNNTTISNCETGLEIYNSNDFGQYFGAVNITGSEFNENTRYGVYVRDIIFQNFLKSMFKGNNTGIYAKNTSIDVNQSIFENNHYFAINQDASGKFCNVQRSNFINNNNYDINANRSNLSVTDNCSFSNSLIGIYIHDGIGTSHRILNSSFTNIPFSIYSTNNTPITISELSYCTFDNYVYGFRSNDISSVSMNGWTIKGNYFTSSDARAAIRTTGGHLYDISENTIIHSTPRAGSPSDLIALEGNLQGIVSCNTLRGPLGLTENDNVHGILLSGGSRNTLSCNNISGSSFNINVTGMSSDAAIKGNTLSNSPSGLLYGIWPSIGGAYTGEQVHAGNIFENATFSSQYGARHLSTDPTEVEMSKYTVNSSANPNFTTEVDAIGDWFEDVPNGTAFTCDAIICPNGIGSNLQTHIGSSKPLSQALINSNLGASEFTSSLVSSGQFYLYQDLIAELVAQEKLDPLTADFISKSENSELGYFTNTLRKLSENLQSFAKLESQSNAIWNQIATLDTSILYNSSQLKSLKDLKRAIKSYDDQYTSLYGDHQNLIATTFNDLNNYSFEDITLDNRSEVILAQLASQMDVLIEYAAIKAIANQCPLDGGDAVYVARSIMEELNGISVYDDYNLCKSEEEKSKLSTERQPNLDLFPNPSSQNVTITSELPIKRIQVIDNAGKIVLLQEVNEKQVKLKIIDLNPGLYIVHVTHENGTTQSKKMIKIE